MNARLTDPAWHLAPTGKADVIVIPAFVSGRYGIRQEFLLQPLPLRTGANRFSCRDHLQEFVPCPQREKMGRPGDGLSEGPGNCPTARRQRSGHRSTQLLSGLNTVEGSVCHPGMARALGGSDPPSDGWPACADACRTGSWCQGSCRRSPALGNPSNHKPGGEDHTSGNNGPSCREPSQRRTARSKPRGSAHGATGPRANRKRVQLSLLQT